MSVQVENLEKNMAKLTIEVPAEELEKALEKAYQKQKKNISVPGFRKGKVPRAMVEKMYGPAVFYEDAVNSLVPEEYSKAAEESKLDIVSRPEINVEQIEKGKAFIFTATVAVKPEVTLGEYKRTKKQSNKFIRSENVSFQPSVLISSFSFFAIKLHHLQPPLHQPVHHLPDFHAHPAKGMI